MNVINQIIIICGMPTILAIIIYIAYKLQGLDQMNKDLKDIDNMLSGLISKLDDLKVKK